MKNIIIAVTALSVIVAGGRFFLLQVSQTAELNSVNQASEELQTKRNQPADVPKVSIQNEFPEKIVYGDDMGITNQAELEIDCTTRGGTFSTCGSTCPSTAEICTEQCAFTCEFSTLTPTPEPAEPEPESEPKIEIPKELDILPVEPPIVCTDDTMMCPDGSYVGRTGPGCSFACPPTAEASNKYDGGTRCVYNQAYQENYTADSIGEIIDNAEGCYVLVDPFDSSEARIGVSKIQEKNNAVGCYISIGTAEDWRGDFDALKPFVASKQWNEWGGEYFIAEISDEVVAIMKQRINTLASLGCDYVEFDNMDWGADEEYVADYDLGVDAESSQSYAEELCAYVHENNMLCMAKSTTYMSNVFDGATYESYVDEKNWWNDSELHKILSADKLGLVVHYDESDCAGVYADYQDIYGRDLSFICEDKNTKSYQHFNE